MKLFCLNNVRKIVKDNKVGKTIDFYELCQSLLDSNFKS